MKIFIFVYLLVMLGYGALTAQELPVVHIIPFENSMNLSGKYGMAYSDLRATLSETGRVKMFSAKAWEKILSTQKLILTVSDFRDAGNALKLGKVSPVDYIIGGEVTAEEEIVIDLINLHSGLIEKTYTIKLGEDLHSQISEIVSVMQRVIVKNGSVLNVESNGKILLSHPELCGWKNGDEFYVINKLGYPYARIRLNSIKKDKAESEIIYYKDKIRSGDNIVYTENFSGKFDIKPCAFLLPIEVYQNSADRGLYYNNARQIIFDSGLLELTDDVNNRKRYNTFKISVERTNYDNIDLLSITVKSYPGRKTVFFNKIACVKGDINLAIEYLVRRSLNAFQRRLLVTKVNNGEITLDEGEDSGVKTGVWLKFKEPGNDDIYGRGKIVYITKNHALARMTESGFTPRPGCYAMLQEQPYDRDKLDEMAVEIDEEVKKAKDIAQKAAENIAERRRKETEEYQQRQKEEQEAILQRMIPKARFRIGGSYLLMENENGKNSINEKSSSQLDADIYLGGHPNFNFVLNYGYTHLAYLDRDGFLYAHSGGAGIKLQFPLFWAIKIYGIALGRYVFYYDRVSEDSENEYPKSFEAVYYNFRAGFDLMVSSGMSFYFEAGRQRVIKCDVKIPEYYTVSGGIAFWFANYKK